MLSKSWIGRRKCAFPLKQIQKYLLNNWRTQFVYDIYFYGKWFFLKYQCLLYIQRIGLGVLHSIPTIEHFDQFSDSSWTCIGSLGESQNRSSNSFQVVIIIPLGSCFPLTENMASISVFPAPHLFKDKNLRQVKERLSSARDRKLCRLRIF